MRPLSARSRLLLERYKTVESIPPAEKDRLLANLQEAVSRGVLPGHDVQVTPLVVPKFTWAYRVWSMSFVRPIIVSTLWALPALAVVGVVSRTAHVAVVRSPATAPSNPTLAQSRPEPTPFDDSWTVDHGSTDLVPAIPAKHTAPSSSIRSRSTTATREFARETTIDGEMRLLKEAQAAGHSGDWHRSLSLLDKYALRFPSGRLADVQAVAHLMALCKLGRTSLARQEADRFLSRYPTSPFIDRVKGVCASQVGPSP